MNNRIACNIKRNFLYNRRLETALRQALKPNDIPTDQRHFEATRLLAGKEARRIPKRRRITFAQFLAAQIRFIGWKIWAVQVLFLSAAYALLFSVNREKQAHHMVNLLFCLSVLVLMTALPFLYRSVRYQMQEVESAARFSLVKLLTAKLVMIGVGNLVMLACIFLAARWKTALATESILISLCFPFLLACSGCLFMLGHLDARRFFAGSMGLCSFLILLFVALFRHYEALLQSIRVGSWITACALLFIICICECRYILYDSSYAEMQLS